MYCLKRLSGGLQSEFEVSPRSYFETCLMDLFIVKFGEGCLYISYYYLFNIAPD